MLRRNKRNASALIVAVGLLAVLSAMAFTYVTIMRVEIDGGIALQTTTETALLDQWALQSVVDRLARTPGQGALYTPVDWAGEEWYNRPLIFTGTNGYSPAMPLGTVMSFGTEMPGKGVFSISAQVMDCSSQVNLADVDWENDTDATRRKRNILSQMPFAIVFKQDPDRNLRTLDSVQMMNEQVADALIEVLQAFQKASGSLTTKDQLLAGILRNPAFKASYGSEANITRYFLGEKDGAGNILTIGFKDFITLNSWVDKSAVSINRDNSSFDLTAKGRAPINVNTAPSWTLKGIFSGLRSTEMDTPISAAEATTLAEYVIAYRTPKSLLPESLAAKQDELLEWITEFTDNAASAGDAEVVTPDPATREELRCHLFRLCHLLVNPHPDTLGEHIAAVSGEAKAPDGGVFNRLPCPFATWAQFDAFLKLLVYKDALGGSIEDGRHKARAIMANCNPNTNYSKQPPRNCWAIWNCGKDRLVEANATTELCFGSFGRFEIEMLLGKTQPVQGGAFAIGALNASEVGSGNDGFSSTSITAAKIRTIKGSLYTPDRFCVYGADGALLATRHITSASGSNVFFDRPMPAKFPANPVNWSIERFDSVKKWIAIAKFVNTIRLNTREDFTHGQIVATGESDPVLFFPDQRFKDSSSKTYDYRDGSITMRCEPVDAPLDAVFRQTFSYGDYIKVDEKGVSDRIGSVFTEGQIFPFGMWLKSGTTEKPLKYPLYTVFPEETKDPQDFTMHMWLCLTDKPGNVKGQIVFSDFSIDFKTHKARTHIELLIDAKRLELKLTGTAIPEKDQKALPMNLNITGDKAISIADWKAGEWHWVGFGFQSSNATGTSEATLFATIIDEAKVTHELVVKSTTLAAGIRMELYKNAVDKDVEFGICSVIADDIVVLKDYLSNPNASLPETRFKTAASTYTSDAFKMVDSNYSQDVEFGTVSWTEYMPWRYLPAGRQKLDDDQEQWANANVEILIKCNGDTTNSPAGTAASSDNHALLQTPIWLAHEDLVAGWQSCFRTGTRGEGQRLATGSKKPEFWSGYESTGNATGKTKDTLTIVARIFGPGGQDSSKPNFETPVVDDITVTFLTPIETLYWKEAMDLSE